MRFFKSLYNSLYNFEWLRNQKKNTSWAWGYFFLLVFLVSGLSVISFGFKYWDEVPKIKQFINNELPDFAAQVNDGKMQITGLTEPYIKKYNNFLVIVDTRATGTISVKSFLQREDESAILIAQEKLEFYDSRIKEVKSEAMKKYSNFKTDRSQILKNSEYIFNKKMFGVFMSVFFLTLMIFLSVSNLVYILLFSSIFYFITKRTSSPWQFKEILNVGLFTITLPLILTQTLPGGLLNWLLMLIFGIWMYLIILKKDIAK
jgi:hypothetical protein